MRGIAYAIVAAGAAACAPAASSTAVAAPVGPLDPLDPPMPAQTVRAAQQASAACSAWAVRWTRHEKTHTVASCQVVPIEVASEIAADIVQAPGGRLSVRVNRDDETADNLPASPSLAGRSYFAEPGAGGLEVRDESGAPLADEDLARRVRAIVSAVTPWGSAIEREVETVVDPRVRGVRAQKVETHVEPARGGAFAVTMLASQSDAGMCHRWETTARLAGDLSLRDGRLERLALRGPTSTTEALCAEGARQSGASAAPRTCTEGEASVSVEATCARAP